MATVTYSAPIASWPHRFFAGFGATLSGIGRVFTISRQCDSRMREVERLNSKTDGELANMGLSRERIVHHVFRDIYYI